MNRLSKLEWRFRNLLLSLDHGGKAFKKRENDRDSKIADLMGRVRGLEDDVRRAKKQAALPAFGSVKECPSCGTERIPVSSGISMERHYGEVMVITCHHCEREWQERPKEADNG